MISDFKLYVCNNLDMHHLNITYHVETVYITFEIHIFYQEKLK